MSRKLNSFGCAALLLAGLNGGLAQAQSDAPPPPTAPMPSAKEMAAAAKTARAGEVGRVSGQLAALQADPQLAARVPPQALVDARAALSSAERAQNDPTSGPHLLYLADRKVQLARALAETAAAQEQYQQLAAQRSPNAGSGAIGTTTITPAIIDTPQQEELQKNAAALRPVRDRGALRFTVDDVLVMPGTITLTPSTSNGLVAISVYLRRNPQSQLLLVGHARGTDGDDSIQRTAQSRADGVRNYLMKLGVLVEQITLDTKVSNDESLCTRCVDAFLDPPWATQSP
ncbi:MAG: OmpA/MotB domain protein [Nevskia sp.]|nr:OmpA/MotB domain protein [Nevskia sp.]